MHDYKNQLSDVYKRQEYGNQVGKAEWDGEGRKTLTIPNWDTNTNKYCKMCIRDRRYQVENLTDYKGIGTFLDEMKEQCFDKYNCMTVAEAPGVCLLYTSRCV